MNQRRPIIFWGATGQARVLHELIRDSAWQLVALVDNRVITSPFPGIEVLAGENGLDEWLSRAPITVPLVGTVAVGGQRGADRLQLMGTLQERGIAPTTLIHASAFVAADSVVGPGCQILAQAAVCSHARLGTGVIINTGASVDHDGEISDGVHIAPGARLAGEVKVGRCAFVGTGAVILPHVTIGEGAIVGAGAVVIHDVSSHTTVVGNPARELRRPHA
ncbi:acetyltransferase [Rhizobacter sp. OV335]|jgi:sugar O-acyltransferase (sialic acid O-acetyltransferase NeuD family)|uniref:acetyltransferase n=1 Tax=Rhizobacter sp. OV335 TaxID=1500264 RepID=UPI00091B7964|nr:acetyltransferase [Rhizobacter sp. OV335]SHL95660.1 sugar O-acyltransferase, sialic acid O-acetyltransferase NeuD family [Rhizobacter sp. OV335]